MQTKPSDFCDKDLIQGPRLAKNTAWNIFGQGFPLLVAVVAIPILIKDLGISRFGVLTLAWAFIGYFSLFDMGIGRALTKEVAERIGTGRTGEVPSLVWTSLFLMLVLGLIGTLLVVLSSRWIVEQVLNIAPDLRQESLGAFLLLSAGIPVVIVTSGLRGVLEAQQRFGVINAIRIPMGIFTFAGPLAVMPFSRRLPVLVAVLVGGRLIAAAVHGWFCISSFPSLRKEFSLKMALLLPLVRYGGWITVSNIIGPVMVYMDRFLIGAMISVAAVGYYTTPYEMVSKLWIIPGGVVGVLFPAFAAIYQSDLVKLRVIFNRGLKFITLVIFPMILILVVFAEEGIRLWLGTDFSRNSYRVLQWLSFGIFMNSLAQMPYTLIQGAGRPDVTAKLHMLELPVYLVLLWFMIRAFGIEGAAIAWVLRMTIDMVLLFIFQHRLFPGSLALALPTAVFILAQGAVLGGAFMTLGFPWKIAYTVISFCMFGSTGWFLVMSPEERVFIRGGFRFPEFTDGR